MSAKSNLQLQLVSSDLRAETALRLSPDNSFFSPSQLLKKSPLSYFFYLFIFLTLGSSVAYVEVALKIFRRGDVPANVSELAGNKFSCFYVEPMNTLALPRPL